MKGVLMARHGCNAEEAFAVLVQASSSASLKLRDVAARLVTEAADRAADGRAGSAEDSIAMVDGRSAHGRQLHL